LKFNCFTKTIVGKHCPPHRPRKGVRPLELRVISKEYNPPGPQLPKTLLPGEYVHPVTAKGFPGRGGEGKKPYPCLKQFNNEKALGKSFLTAYLEKQGRMK